LGLRVLLRAIEVLRELGIDRLWWKRSHCLACFSAANDGGDFSERRGLIALVGCQ
jgi:hypothetical protein